MSQMKMCDNINVRLIYRPLLTVYCGRNERETYKHTVNTYANFLCIV